MFLSSALEGALRGRMENDTSAVRTLHTRLLVGVGSVSDSNPNVHGEAARHVCWPLEGWYWPGWHGTQTVSFTGVAKMEVWVPELQVETGWQIWSVRSKYPRGRQGRIKVVFSQYTLLDAVRSVALSCVNPIQ